ncbi:endonuclease domain-containing protein [Marinifilum fragile]|uniref:endonuclease domain-containing protein n=1 Tax=Marinifilum fragile TaxID=570161 RepID=UPI002AA61ED7|nr:endonuclease domain-containing protein [Marinifilum fragile]
MKYSDIKQFKQTLRKKVTPSEQVLWKHIRRRQLKGRKFLRQHAIVYDSINKEHFLFIPDFYCKDEQLAIELDGKIHDFQKAKDQNRDEILRDMDITVLRIKNEELSDIQKVLDKITSHFKQNDDDPVFKRKTQ